MLRLSRIHVALGATAIAAPLLAGCGNDRTHANEERPPSPIVVTASISKHKVSVSPTTFGAGPIRLVITNQTDRSQQITLESADDPGSGNAGIRQETGPINPRDTASLAANVTQGPYRVHVKGNDISAARLDVGEERASAQQDLLLP
ncbi:hypothetical protein [Capillimicrobium parvum]|uniref:Lipoprotein n=1 Tax=Capillimicrobium parvum TaxID=2884022 RepID=A0A9E7BZK1_9ACTN|nr:hypothetical protein [Capillimicrobium parvum]UGS35460.1 hypothetical protein DSM104329_01848 [Capillimicrobium parvum]